MGTAATEIKEVFSSRKKVSELLQKIVDKDFLENGEKLISIGALVYDVSTAFKRLRILSNLKDMQNHIQSKIDKHEKFVGGAFDSFVKLYGDDVKKLIEPVKGNISGKTWEVILKELSEIERVESNKLVATVACEGIVLMISDYVFLTLSFLTLSSAENVSKNNQAFERINEHFTTVQVKIGEIKTLFATDPKSKLFDDLIKKKLYRISRLSDQVWREISELNVKIDGRLQKLESIFYRSGEGTLTNAFSLLVSGVQLGLTWTSLNLFSAVVGGGVMALRVGALFGNVAVHIVSKKQLEAMKKDRDRVICLKKKYDELNDEIEQLGQE